ncbi:hypothetical protein [Ferrimonas sp.]|uniref:hypothetical protein n=1 Tax=Ferrimonas sp. TaxID=2080861 RepID=UPI003A8E960A
MSKLATVCLALWLVPFVGAKMMPEVFCAWYVYWPLFCALCFLLPYGFAKSLGNHLNRAYSSLFLAVFLVVIFANALVVVGASGIGRVVTIPTQGVPENLSVEAVRNDSPMVRLQVAQSIYVEYGQSITYLDADNTLKLYVPSEEDKERFQEKVSLSEQAREVNKVVNSRVQNSVVALGLACASFFVVFFCIFGRESRRLSRRHKSQESNP